MPRLGAAEHLYLGEARGVSAQIPFDWILAESGIVKACLSVPLRDGFIHEKRW